MAPPTTTIICDNIDVPEYLTTTYDWAYVTPEAVKRFERQWLVNMILWGNFARLRDEALGLLGEELTGRTLQIACVYGDLTSRLVARHSTESEIDVIDVLPVQTANLKVKLASAGIAADRVGIHLGNSAAMSFADANYDRALLFFLLHEQPEEVRKRTLAEALRVVKPGGKLVIVDYHRPSVLHPLWLPMRCILSTLEPFALDLWRNEIEDWFPADITSVAVTKRTTFGGLYQLVEVTR